MGIGNVIPADQESCVVPDDGCLKYLMNPELSRYLCYSGQNISQAQEYMKVGSMLK
jgi:hypothetical protein